MNIFNYKNIIKNKLFRPMFIVYTALSLGLFVFIPNQMDEVVENYIKKDSLELIKFLEASKMYYNDYIIDDIQHHEDEHKPFTFGAQHKNITGVLPLPAIFLEDLSTLANPARKTTLYSEEPFKNRQNRVLSRAQKNILATIEQTDDGIIMENEIIDGVEYIRVAKINYMTHQACIDCHNNHEDRLWSTNRWKIGDMRGVLETLTPIDKTIHNKLDGVRWNIVWMVLASFLTLFLYYGYIIIKREEELNTRHEGLEVEFSDHAKQLNLKNIALEHDMAEMFKDFDDAVIYSKTNLFGTITESSSAFCKISGYSQEELIGRPHNIVRHPDMEAATFQDIWDTIEADRVWKGEVKNLKKDGGYYWVNSIISPMYDQGGTKTGYISIRYDITKQKDNHMKELKKKLKGKRTEK